MRAQTVVAAAVMVWTLSPAAHATAQTATPLQTGVDLYAAASYDDALTAFEAAAATDLSLDDRVALDQHRMLCLLALGRAAAADAAAVSLLQAKPDFVLTANDASPRVRAMFDQTRRRVLPSVVRQRYTEARQMFDAGAVDDAHTAFAALAGLLSDPQMSSAGESFDDLRTLVNGFQQLTAATIEARTASREPVLPLPTPLTFGPPRRDAAHVSDSTSILALVPPVAVAPRPPAATESELPAPAAPPPVAAVVAGAESVTPTARPFAPLDIFTYDWRDKDVAPPVAVSQGVQGWWGSMGEPAPGTALGAVDVVVDETGRVVDARIYQSVNRVYDAVLVASVRQWRYQPAVKDGRAVKYRRITGVVSGR